jgi:outer membrane protein assembly factor BamE
MRYLFILLAFLCVSCGTALPSIKPYKLDVQQGNVVTSKMLLQLRPGMTKSQVRFIMGTPLIQDSFHGNRWDYVYQMREGGKLKEQRRVIMDFENELLKSVRGDVIPSGSDQSKAGETEGPTGTRVVTPIKKPEEKGLLKKLKFWEKDEAELAKEAAEKEAAAKAKLEAEETAKNAAARQSQGTPAADIPAVVAPAVEEPKSLLAVPIQVPAVTESPAATPSAAEVPKVDAAPIEAVAPVVVPPAVAAEPQSVEPAPVSAQPAAAPAPAVPPAQSQPYDSSSGMQFDRKLRLEAEEADEPAPQPAVTQPRAGNKVPPTPKDLPAEGDASYFDRILEQIGF